MIVTRLIRRASTFGAFVVLVAAPACNASDAVAVRTDLLTASAESDGGVRLQNRTEQPVYYFVADRQALALLDWAPCTRPESCASVPPHGSTRVPRTSIAADQPGSREVVVYHWLLVSSGSAFRPDSIRATIVTRD